MKKIYVHRMLVLTCLAGLASAGCSVFNRSSLASNSGPKPPGGEWSAVSEQWVHVGEKVDFSYAVLSGGEADYAIIEVLQLDTAKVSLVSEAGRFFFQGLTFNEPTPPGKPLIIKATAWRQRGERDFMDMDGKLLTRESPSDAPDALVCSAVMKLHVYQANLTMQVPGSPAGYRWETAKLVFHGEGEALTEIQSERPYRKGFHVEGPDAAGAYVVSYKPTADQIRRTGTTRVVLTVQDGKGKEYNQEMQLPTP